MYSIEVNQMAAPANTILRKYVPWASEIHVSLLAGCERQVAPMLQKRSGKH